MPQTDNNTTQVFELTDVDVEALGLVDKGAIGQDFFLLKSDGEQDEADDKNQDQGMGVLAQIGAARLLKLAKTVLRLEQEQSEPDDGVIEKILGSGAKRGIQALLNSYGDELPGELKSALQGALSDTESLDDDDDSDDESGDDGMEKAAADTGAADNTNKESVMSDTKVEDTKVKDNEAGAAQPDVQTDVSKAESDTPTQESGVDFQAEIAKRDAQLTELSKRFDAMQADLEKAQTETKAANAKAEVERQSRLLAAQVEVAKGFESLGANPDELGEFLHFLSESDSRANVAKSDDDEGRADRHGYLVSLLKAINEQAAQGALFKEAGSQNVDETLGKDMLTQAQALVEKGDYETLKEALLHLPDDMAAEYIANTKPQ